MAKVIIPIIMQIEVPDNATAEELAALCDDLDSELKSHLVESTDVRKFWMENSLHAKRLWEHVQINTVAHVGAEEVV